MTEQVQMAIIAGVVTTIPTLFTLYLQYKTRAEIKVNTEMTQKTNTKIDQAQISREEIKDELKTAVEDTKDAVERK